MCVALSVFVLPATPAPCCFLCVGKCRCMTCRSLLFCGRKVCGRLAHDSCVRRLAVVLMLLVYCIVCTGVSVLVVGEQS